MLVRNLLSEDIVLGLIALKRKAEVIVPPVINIKQDLADMKYLIISKMQELLKPYADFIDLNDYSVDRFEVSRFDIIGDDLTMWLSFINKDRLNHYKGNREVSSEYLYITVHEWSEGITNPTYTYKLRVHNYCMDLDFGFRELPQINAEMIL